MPLHSLFLGIITILGVILTTTTTTKTYAAAVSPITPIYTPLIETLSNLNIQPKNTPNPNDNNNNSNNNNNLQFFPGETVTITYEESHPLPSPRTKITIEHERAALVVIGLQIANGNEFDPITTHLTSTTYYNNIITFILPDNTPSGTHKLSITYIHDYSITSSTTITVIDNCESQCGDGVGQKCQRPSGQCVCDIDQGYVQDPSIEGIISCIPKCMTLDCMNGSFCDIGHDLKVCSCPNDVFSIDGVLIEFTGETCNAIKNRNIENCTKPCGTGGSQIYNQRGGCNGECQCEYNNWAKHPILGVCSVCTLQAAQFCHIQNTNLTASYSVNGTCDKCICKDGYAGDDCSYEKLYFSIYIGAFSFTGINGINQSTTPTTNSTQFFPQQQVQNNQHHNFLPIDQIYDFIPQQTSQTDLLLTPLQQEQFINIISLALGHDKRLITIELNQKGTSRFIFSIAIKSTIRGTESANMSLPSSLQTQNVNNDNFNFDLLNVSTQSLSKTNYNTNISSTNELNLRWLQFRKQLTLSFAHNDQIWSQFGNNFLPDVMYDPQCPSLTTLAEQISNTTISTRTISTKEPSLYELFNNNHHNQLFESVLLGEMVENIQKNLLLNAKMVQFDPLVFLKVNQLDNERINSELFFLTSTTTTKTKISPINFDTNLKLTNPIVNQLTYRCLYNIDPFQFAYMGSDNFTPLTVIINNKTITLPSGPLSDDYYTILGLNLPIFDPYTRQYVKYQGKWIDNHTSELLLTVILGTLFSGLVLLICIKECLLASSPRRHLQKNVQVE